MTAYEPELWHDLFLATAGAAAALAGLLFVAVSINLTRILQYPDLPSRAGEAILILIQALLVSVAALVPDQSTIALGLVVLAISLTATFVCVRDELGSRRQGGVAREHLSDRVLINAAGTLPFVLGGLSLTVSWGGGLYVVAAAIGLAFAVATLTAWIMLVEILR